MILNLYLIKWKEQHKVKYLFSENSVRKNNKKKQNDGTEVGQFQSQ